jgi:hypothetical protein
MDGPELLSVLLTLAVAGVLAGGLCAYLCRKVHQSAFGGLGRLGLYCACTAAAALLFVLSLLPLWCVISLDVHVTWAEWREPQFLWTALVSAILAAAPAACLCRKVYQTPDPSLPRLWLYGACIVASGLVFICAPLPVSLLVVLDRDCWLTPPAYYDRDSILRFAVCAILAGAMCACLCLWQVVYRTATPSLWRLGFYYWCVAALLVLFAFSVIPLFAVVRDVLF